ncbi:MAG: transketolase C-terminal domain-containing protein [Solirubrobacteraceae bacterium]
MRDAFAAALTRAAIADDQICLVLADLGVGVFDELASHAPDRIVNAGIAEQAMIGVAAGLAQAGKRPVAYTIAPFITSRAHDQVRVDVAAGNANVTLVGVGGGVAYGYLGLTHHAIDDLAAMRALPNMTILSPCDPGDAGAATAAALALDGPVYLRLGKNGEPTLLPERAPFQIGRAARVRAGADVTIASTGPILASAIGAADLLERGGIDAGVLHFGTVKPLDADAVSQALADTGVIVAVEEHSIVGGLGSAIAEIAAETGAGRVLRAGFPDRFVHEVGAREHLLACHGLDAAGVAQRVRVALGAAAPHRAAPALAGARSGR